LAALVPSQAFAQGKPESQPKRVTVTAVTDLNFGVIAQGGGGAITISPSSTPSRTTSGGAYVISSSQFTAAAFDVTVAKSDSYSITLPTSVTLTSPGDSMTLSAFTSSPAASNGKVDLTDGTTRFYVGATLSVAASQLVGTYSGTVPITISFP